MRAYAAAPSNGMHHMRGSCFDAIPSILECDSTVLIGQGRGFFPRWHGAALCRPLPSLRVGAPRNAPQEEASPSNILRDHLVSQGPGRPKPPPFPAGNDVSGCPGSAGYLGGSRLKALSSDARESDRGYGFGGA
jgi:hypothetical protein